MNVPLYPSPPSPSPSSSISQVIRNHPQVPQEWKTDTMYERSFAVFYNAHVQKGSYKMNAEGKVSVLRSLLAQDTVCHANAMLFNPSRFDISVPILELDID